MPDASEALSCAQALVEAWNAHDVDRVVALHAEDYEGDDVAAARPVRGRAALRRATEAYLRAFPDLRLCVDRVLAQGHEVALAWRAYGTHRGPLLHIPPTQHRVEIRGMTLLEVADGKVRRSRAVWDLAGLLRTLGLLPSLRIDP